eukprot:gene9092-biopygen154
MAGHGEVNGHGRGPDVDCTRNFEEAGADRMQTTRGQGGEQVRLTGGGGPGPGGNGGDRWDYYFLPAGKGVTAGTTTFWDPARKSLGLGPGTIGVYGGAAGAAREENEANAAPQAPPGARTRATPQRYALICYVLPCPVMFCSVPRRVRGDRWDYYFLPAGKGVTAGTTTFWEPGRAWAWAPPP